MASAPPIEVPPQPQARAARQALHLGLLSIAGLASFTGIPAIILARRARRQIQASGGVLGGEREAALAIKLAAWGLALWGLAGLAFFVGLLVLPPL